MWICCIETSTGRSREGVNCQAPTKTGDTLSHTLHTYSLPLPACGFAEQPGQSVAETDRRQYARPRRPRA